MYDVSALLFHEPLSPKSYLDQILLVYPYDIEPALVYTLLTQAPYPHPALLTFIDFVRHTRKYLLCTQTMQEPHLNQLYVTMCTLSQKNTAVLHTHQFHMDALFHCSSYPHHQPYSSLSLENIPLIDQVHISQNASIDLPKSTTQTKLHWITQFPYANISIDPLQYLAISIQITDYQGILYLPLYAISCICAISTLYQIKKPSEHNDFYMIYGVQTPENQNVLYYDETNQLYLGLSTKSSPIPSLSECIKMIQALYCAICLKKQDLNIPSSMITIQKGQVSIGLLLCGEANSGKSELLDAFMNECKKEGWSITKIFENYGTLHILDERLVATGSQIGAMIHGDALPRTTIYNALSSSVLVKEEHTTTFFLTPFTTYEETCRFHSIDMIVFMDKQTKATVLEQVVSLEAALQQMHTLLNTSLIKDVDTALFLWKQCLTTAFLNEIPIYHLSSQHKYKQNKTRYTRNAKKLLKLIKEREEMR